MIPDFTAETIPQPERDPIEVFRELDRMIDAMQSLPRPRKCLILPGSFFKVRPKPRWYCFWTKARRLRWLKNNRRRSLILEKPEVQAAFNSVDVVKSSLVVDDGKAFVVVNP